MDSLLQTVADLFSLLAERKVNYVLVGGIALLNYVEGRNTEDVDLILTMESLARLPEIELVTQEMYFARGRFRNLQIDLLLTTNPLFAKIQADYAAQLTYAEQTIRTATVEGLLLLKLYALPSLYRQGNFAKVGLYENDIATLLHDYEVAPAPLVATLGSYLSESDQREIAAILVDIQQRIARFRNRADNAHDDWQNAAG